MCPNAIERGVCHRAGLSLLSNTDFEPTDHMTWELLSYNAHIYFIKDITNSYKYETLPNAKISGVSHQAG